MMMHYAIEIRFDQESETKLLGLWQRAASFYESDYLIRNNVIPHLALLVGDSKLLALFRTLTAPSGLIGLSSFSFFDNGRICFLRANPSAAIIDFQKSVYNAARDLDARIDDHYAPNRWIPHCTIAQDCKTHRNHVMEKFQCEASVRSLILVQFPPSALLGETTAPKEH